MKMFTEERDLARLDVVRAELQANNGKPTDKHNATDEYEPGNLAYYLNFSAFHCAALLLQHGVDPNAIYPREDATILDTIIMWNNRLWQLPAARKAVCMLIFCGGRTTLPRTKWRPAIRNIIEATERARVSTFALGTALKWGRIRATRDIRTLLMQYVWATMASERWME
jgi:hypothetical protein